MSTVAYGALTRKREGSAQGQHQERSSGYQDLCRVLAALVPGARPSGAFDARVGETAESSAIRLGCPPVNPNLLMGEDLLKKTGAGNLITVFGEPDVNIKEEEGELVGELLGVDVYDPTTSEVRSSSTDDKVYEV